MKTGVVAVLLGLCAWAEAAVAQEVVSRNYVDSARRNWQDDGPRPLRTLVWDTRTPAARHPLLLLSHGTSGDPNSLAWLAEHFAAHGYIVAAIYHHGDTTAEGAQRPPQGRLHFWERAADVSAVLNALLEDPAFGPRIARDRIFGAGYSAGGGTMMLLAGARFRPGELEARCARQPEAPECFVPPMIRADLDRIQAQAKTDRVLQASLARREQSFREPRIRAVLAIAPALGDVFTEADLKRVTLPVAIVASSADEVTPLQPNAQKYANFIPSAKLTVLPGAATHLAVVRDPSLRPFISQLAFDFFASR